MKKEKSEIDDFKFPQDELYLNLLCSDTNTFRGLIKNKDYAYYVIECLEKAFKNDGNPIYALTAFDVAWDIKHYPPQWALEVLSKAFKQFLSNMGNPKVSLDALFGFNKRGKGRGRRTSKREEKILKDRDTILSSHLFILEEIFGLEPKEALSAVYQTFCNKNNQWIISERTLSDIHSKYSQKASLRGIIRAEMSKAWTEQHKTEYLKQYLPDVLPKRFFTLSV